MASAARVFILLVSIALSVDGERSKQYRFPSKSCNRPTDTSREIDGAMIYSSDNPLYMDSLCILKFRADSDYLMVNLEHWDVTDCSVKLQVFYSSSTHGRPDASFNCTTKNPRPLYSRGRFVTLRLEKRNVRGYSFKIVLTSYKIKSFCSGYQCGDNNGFCIDDDLRCDGVKNCLDGRDEFDCAVRTRRVGYKSMIGVAVFILLLALACTGLFVFYCRRRRAHAGTVIRSPPPVDLTASTTVVAPPPPPGTYPTQPVYPPPGQPAYGATYPPAGAYPPPPGAYPPPNQPAYPPSAAPPPAYADNPYSDQKQPPAAAAAGPYAAAAGPYAAPPPLSQQVGYSAGQQSVNF